jgi:diphthamide biosynthesis enzyme Dph1/Dph2-like protein
MKPLYIETRRKFKNINLEPLNKLKGKTISLAATIQYIDLIPKVKKYLESKNKKIITKQGAYYKAHIIGCNASALDKSADNILIITDGKFHAINNAIQIQKPIYIFDTKTLDKITQKEIDTYNKKILAKQKKFLTSRKVGLLLSTKHGQKFEAITQIKSKIEKLDKKVYIFKANNINMNEFENFPQIQIWINTACPGLTRNNTKIINLSDITSLISK